MKVLLVTLAALGTSAHAAPTLSFEPANPTPADTIVVSIRDDALTCPYIVSGSTRVVRKGEIRLKYSYLEDCGGEPNFEAKATLGRLPAGTYIVTLGLDGGGPLLATVDKKELEVRLPGMAEVCGR